MNIKDWFSPKGYTEGYYGQGKTNKSIEQSNIGCGYTSLLIIVCLCLYGAIYGLTKLLIWYF